MHFEVDQVYSVASDGTFDFNSRDIRFKYTDYLLFKNTLKVSPIIVEGMKPNDFAVFATVFDEDGAEEIPFLVLDYRRKTGSAVLAACELVEAQLDKYVSPHLVRTMRSIDRGELAQFTINELVEYVDAQAI
jgi:hypothetical protein